MKSRKDARRDEWDARYAPAVVRRPRGGNRGQGLSLLLLGVGLPLVAFFIQVDGAIRFSTRDQIFERTLTAAEKQEIRAAVARHQAKLDAVGRVVERIKERYRAETGAAYDRDVWVVHVKNGLAIPYKYVLAIGALIFLFGLGRLVV